MMIFWKYIVKNMYVKKIVKNCRNFWKAIRWQSIWKRAVQKKISFIKEEARKIQVIQQSILYRKKDTDFQIGIGKSVEGYQRLKESYDEASQAIKYIEIIRQVTGDKNKSMEEYRYDGTGFTKK